jgi:hypothetical protein
MTKRVAIIGLGLCVLLWGSVAWSLPLDLSTFTADPLASGSGQPGVWESGGVVEFVEDITYSNLLFYDPAFFVEPTAGTLSFDYDFQLGEFDFDDYLSLGIDFLPVLDVDTDITGGHFDLDLGPYQGTTIDLAWSLNWDGDFDADTTARVYNIEITPIPEPCTMLLVGTGLAGLAAAGRKRGLGIFR